MKEQKLSIDAARQAIETERPRVNIRNSKQVASFNQRVEQFQQMIRRYNADVADVNTWVSARAVLINNFTVFCQNRVYRKSNLAFLPSDLRTALEKVAGQTDIPLLDEPETRVPMSDKVPARSF